MSKCRHQMGESVLNWPVSELACFELACFQNWPVLNWPVLNWPGQLTGLFFPGRNFRPVYRPQASLIGFGLGTGLQMNSPFKILREMLKAKHQLICPSLQVGNKCCMLFPGKIGSFIGHVSIPLLLNIHYPCTDGGCSRNQYFLSLKILPSNVILLKGMKSFLQDLVLGPPPSQVTSSIRLCHKTVSRNNLLFIFEIEI